MRKIVIPAGCALVVLALIIAAVALGDGPDRHTSGVVPAPHPTRDGEYTRPMPTSAVGQWDVPARIDGWTVTLSRPVDESAKYPCTGCSLPVLTMLATITAGVNGVDPSAIMISVVDANYSKVGVTSFGDVVMPPGKSRTTTVQLQPEKATAGGTLTITIVGDNGQSVTWIR